MLPGEIRTVVFMGCGVLEPAAGKAEGMKRINDGLVLFAGDRTMERCASRHFMYGIDPATA